MSEPTIDPRYLEMFPQWLRSLGEDAAQVGDTLAKDAAPDEATRSLVAGLNYIFKSLDLIPDGIDDLGYLDDAFVLRVACALAGGAKPELKQGVVQRLGDDAHAVKRVPRRGLRPPRDVRARAAQGRRTRADGRGHRGRGRDAPAVPAGSEGLVVRLPGPRLHPRPEDAGEAQGVLEREASVTR